MTKTRIICIVGFLFGGTILGVPRALGVRVTIREGSLVQLRATRTVSSEDAQVGDDVNFLVVSLLKVDNTVVIPIGAQALGKVKEVKRGGRVKGNPRLVIEFQSVNAIGGKDVVPLRDRPSRDPQPEKRRLHEINTTSRDEPASVVRDQTLNAYVDRDISLDIPETVESRAEQPKTSGSEAKATPGEVKPAPPEKPAPPLSGEPAVLSITSDPQGASIEIDGNFVGTAPSEIPLPPGKHKVVISKTGYKPKEYPLTAMPGAKASLIAELEKE